MSKRIDINSIPTIGVAVNCSETFRYEDSVIVVDETDTEALESIREEFVADIADPRTMSYHRDEMEEAIAMIDHELQWRAMSEEERRATIAHNVLVMDRGVEL
ncbi:hypothetical protein SEA_SCOOBYDOOBYDOO_36 [Mycobacterium phage ScoobyDoobyDoo]|nr:hypothetical protein SEA_SCOOBYDOOBYDOO_36 [Mycobacterium phage ScoobyDoobyDoo]